MYAEERQQEMLRRVRVVGRADVMRLADEMGVTSETIHRDLTPITVARQARHALHRARRTFRITGRR